MSLELEELHLALYWTKDAKKKDPKSALSSKYKTKLSALEKASVRLKDVKNFEEYRDMVKIHSDALLGRTAIKAKLKGPKSGEFHNFFYRLKAAHTLVKAKSGTEIKEEEFKEINDIMENIPDFDKMNPSRPYLLLKIHSLLGLGAVKEAASLSGSLNTELKAVIDELNQGSRSKDKIVKAEKEESVEKNQEKPVVKKPVVKKAKAKKTRKSKVNLGKYKIYISSANKKLDQGNTTTAVKLYKKALGVNPKKGTKAMLGLGWSYLDLGNNRQAEKYFKMAKGANPRIGESYWGLAEVYGAMKKGPLKKMMCREYLRVAPKGPEAAIARRCAK